MKHSFVSNLLRFDQFRWPHGLALAVLVLLVVLPTVVPEIYYFVDNPEYVLTINSLGVAHPPGYPLVMLLGKLYSVLLPLGTLTWRLNTLSAVFLALAVPFIAQTLDWLLKDFWLAVGGTLLFAWSTFVWTTAVSVEIYAPQVFGLAVALWLLVRAVRQTPPTHRDTVLVGLGLALALAFHPVNALFIPACALVLWRKRAPAKALLIAAALMVALPTLCYLLYYAARSGAPDAFSIVGTYDAQGQFTPRNLRSFGELVAYVTGQQFDGYFNLFPSGAQIGQTLQLFLQNYLYVGLLLGLVGLYALAQKNLQQLLLWLLFFLPYTYFFTTWGADDTITMFNPALLLWVYPLLLGLRWFLEGMSAQQKRLVLLALVVACAVFNFVTIRAERNDDLSTLASARMAAFPPNAVVIGNWSPIMPLFYVQGIHQQRPDVKLINVDGYYHDLNALRAYLDAQIGQRPVVIVQQEAFTRSVKQVLADYQLAPLPFTSMPVLTSDAALQAYWLDEAADQPLAGYLITGKT